MSENKPVLGRPTKFKPEFCQALIKHMSKGLSFETFAATIDVNVDTIYEWRKSQPLFSEAFERGRLKSQLFWEKMGIDHIISTSDSERSGDYSQSKSRTLNAAVWKFNMINRFKWSERQTIQTDDDKPVEIAFSPKEMKKQA